MFAHLNVEKSPRADYFRLRCCDNEYIHVEESANRFFILRPPVEEIIYNGFKDAEDLRSSIEKSVKGRIQRSLSLEIWWIMTIALP